MKIKRGLNFVHINEVRPEVITSIIRLSHAIDGVITNRKKDRSLRGLMIIKTEHGKFWHNNRNPTEIYEKLGIKYIIEKMY